MPTSQMSSDDLYPPLDAWQHDFLAVDDLHRVYYEQCGNPHGVPVLFLHGGPGAGCSTTHRRFFDSRHYRIILMDQRGAGRSTPPAETRDNSPDLLVQDCETLRRHLGIEKWHVFGGSWGSTLALLYAETHPESVLSLTLRGIFMMHPSEIDWFLYGMQEIFPEAWAKFSDHIPADERHDLLESYWHRLTSPDMETRIAAARIWSDYERGCSTLKPNPAPAHTAEQIHHDLGLATLEAHFFRNHLFTPHDRILQNIDRIRHIPAVIIQGRYDIICPIRSAEALHRAWPEADYIIIPDAGHSAFEPGIRKSLVKATDHFRKISLNP